MPDYSFLSLAGAKVEAAAAKTRLANSVLHLYKAGWVPTPTTLLAEYLANECDFDGYAAKTIAAWGDPILASAAYVIFAPSQTFPWQHVAADVGNQVGGAFLVTAGGDLYQATVYDPTRPCQGPDQAIVTTPADIYQAG